jgi:hypothetical protein
MPTIHAQTGHSIMWSLVRLLTFLLLASPAVAQTDPYLASNGTFKIPFALTNTWTAVQTFNVAPVFGILPSVPLVQFQILQGNGSGIAAPVTFSAAIDAAVGSTRGSILERGVSGWQIVAPGATALPWVSNGTGADPGYQALTAAGIAAGTITNSNLTTMAANTIKCNPTGSTAAVQDCTTSQVQNIVNAVQCANITSSAFGGAGNNSTDNATPLATAFASLAAPGGCIYFPPGKYKFNSAPSLNLPSGIFALTIIGAGADNTILTWPAAAGGITINYSGIQSSAHVRDITFTTGTTAGGNALKLANANTVANPAFSANSDLYRVTFRGDDGYGVTDYWTNALQISNVNNTQVDGVQVSGASAPNGTGINIAGIQSPISIAVVLNVAKSTFNQLGTGILYGNQVQGVTCDQCNFTATQQGIAAATTEAGLAQLAVTNSQFYGAISNSNGILAQSLINDVTISNNLFLIGQSGSIGVSLAQSGLTSIFGNVFWGQNAAASEQGIFVSNTNSLPCIFANNVFFGFNGTTAVGLSLGASTANCTVTGNSFLTNTVNVSDSGTNNQYWNNSGFDPAWATFTPSATLTGGTCTGGVTTNTARRKTVGKQTWFQLDVTFGGAIGAACNSLNWTLPNTAASSAMIVGMERATNTGFSGCLTGTASSAVTCLQTAGANYANSQHWIFSGTYENQ